MKIASKIDQIWSILEKKFSKFVICAKKIPLQKKHLLKVFFRTLIPKFPHFWNPFFGNFPNFKIWEYGNLGNSQIPIICRKKKRSGLHFFFRYVFFFRKSTQNFFRGVPPYMGCFFGAGMVSRGKN